MINSIGSLNTCGLKRKTDYPEVQNLINQYDVVFFFFFVFFFLCIAESKLDNDDVISYSDLTFYNYPRKQSYCRKSGGLGFFVRHTLAKYVDMIGSSSEYIAWIKISQTTHK